MKRKITQTLVNGLTPPERGNKITYDTEVRGFGVRITKAGTISFVLNYYLKGRERRITIGQAPEFTATSARKKTLKLRAKITEGIDPLDEKLNERNKPTVTELYNDYKSLHLPKLTDRSQKDQISMWQKYLLPEIGKKKVEDVNEADIQKIHRFISRHAPIRANRVIEVLRKALNLAIKWKWIKDNPAVGFDKNKEFEKERFLSEEELTKIADALNNMPNRQAADAIRLLILTGARRGEVLNAEWSHIDLQKGIWIKPHTHTKAGREHRVVLSVEACEILKEMKLNSTSNYLFPSSKGTPIMDFKRSWAWLKEETGLHDVRIHDLRHTFASILISHGVGLPVIGRLLGHSQYQTTMRYAKLMDEPLREATGIISRVLR